QRSACGVLLLADVVLAGVRQYLGHVRGDVLVDLGLIRPQDRTGGEVRQRLATDPCDGRLVDLDGPAGHGRPTVTLHHTFAATLRQAPTLGGIGEQRTDLPRQLVHVPRLDEAGRTVVGAHHLG